MKKILLILIGCVYCIIAASCEKEVYYKWKYWNDYNPYKGASLKISWYDTKQEVYVDSVSVEFEDSCSMDCGATVFLDGKILVSKKGTTWRFPIAVSSLKKTGYDTLLFDFSYKGYSNRYHCNYERKMIRYIIISPRRLDRVKDNNFKALAGAVYYRFQEVGDEITVTCDSFYTPPYSNVAHIANSLFDNRLLFNSAGGNQLHLKVDWDNNSAVEEVSIWFDNKLLDIVDPNGWTKRYYLDELPQDGNLEFHVKYKGTIRVFQIPRKEYVSYGVGN